MYQNYETPNHTNTHTELEEIFIPTSVNPNFEVSNLGRVRNIKKNRIIKNTLNKEGYYQVFLEGTIYKLHRLIAAAFIPNPDNLAVVNHKDSNRANNALDNLEWTSYQGNTEHGYRFGNMKKGSEHPRAKLTDEQVASIRKRSTAGAKKSKLAAEYDVSWTHIYNIIRGSRRNLDY